ncbi:MAG: SAM-dependent methyltransferase [Bacteroidota bacterium]|jgi:16S rRNA (cytidine1402-2'-O)-methyltransferase|nr:SAM-dependent methyltransferase [Bacteroidota bacterium]
MQAKVYLIPTVLYEGQTDCLPAYILPAIKECNVFFVENERTARRFLKLLSKEIIIDDYEWYNIKETTHELINTFKNKIAAKKTIGIMSEAGCPGIADPGQKLVQVAQEMNIVVKPLVGPNSILLALMASGLNGQQFQFLGYLPIEVGERVKSLQKLESESKQKNCTQIFIETPYRNNQLFEIIIKTCSPNTLVCVAVDLTAETEMIKTMTAQQWKKQKPELHKRPALFLIYAGS